MKKTYNNIIFFFRQCKEIARIRIQGLPGSGLRFFALSGFDEYGSETLVCATSYLKPQL